MRFGSDPRGRGPRAPTSPHSCLRTAGVPSISLELSLGLVVGPVPVVFDAVLTMTSMTVTMVLLGVQCRSKSSLLQRRREKLSE